MGFLTAGQEIEWCKLSYFRERLILECTFQKNLEQSCFAHSDTGADFSRFFSVAHRAARLLSIFTSSASSYIVGGNSGQQTPEATRLTRKRLHDDSQDNESGSPSQNLNLKPQTRNLSPPPPPLSLSLSSCYFIFRIIQNARSEYHSTDIFWSWNEFCIAQ